MREVNLTESELAAIGRVTQEWARLEGAVHLLISGMIGGPLIKAGLVGPSMGSKLAMEFAAALATAHFSDVARHKAVAKLTERGSKLAARRNDVVHQIWARGKRPHELVAFGLKVRNTIKLSVGPSSAKEFTHLANEIKALSRDFDSFLEANGLYPVRPA